MPSTKRVTAHLTPATIEAAGTADSLSSGLNRIADRYRVMVQSVNIEARFSRFEWSLIRDAMKEVPIDTAAAIRGAPARAVAESADSCHISARAMRTLRALTYVEEVALVDYLERNYREVGAGGESHWNV